ncbi:SUKH-3 domain-containing protein [Catellatospora tritici]|uniref:SUKH-3 domain-containing protein n=1 Tax=Catellatospora tritici TaxID=2851566 RepID=UPI001C2D2CA3|nr:SUKH-3 domain-containing protein [Catellatospora tritici]MBV1852435.1 SUKH-3 domain-containing protein [Catellatospora tritici]
MVTELEARRLAEHLARAAAEPGAPALVPHVAEFPECFIVWALPDEHDDVPPPPGAGARTVIDRGTAALSTYPSVPLEHVRRLHRQRLAEHPPAPVTADPLAALRRVGRGESPGIAAELTPADGRTRRATGAKGDQLLRHHRLVGDWLADQPTGTLVRGAARHAELIVLSDWLHELDQRAARDGAPAVDLAMVRELTASILDLRITLLRDPGDPLDGTPGGPCDTCLAVWIHVGLAPESAAQPPREPVAPITGVPAALAGLPEDIAITLAAGGWDRPVRVGGRDLTSAEWADLSVRALAAHGHPPLETLRAAIVKFPYLASVRRGPGVANRVQPFEFGAELVSHTAATLARFAEVSGVPLAPIGAEHDGDGVVAIDALGRVWVLDQAGEWYAGPDLDTAFTVLLQGHPMPRVRDDGNLAPPGQ